LCIPGGQALAKRITKQILSASRRLNQALKGYNEVPAHGARGLPYKLQRADVTALDSEIWGHLSTTPLDGSDVPPTLQRKLVDNLRLHKRAAEEIDMVRADMQRVLRGLQREEELLMEAIKIQRHESTVSTVSTYDHGCLSLMVSRLYKTRMQKEEVIFILSKATPNTQMTIEQFLQDVENQLNPETLELPKMEINDILEEIDSLEDEMNDEIATEEADED
jgi:hypothetical protein